MIRARHTSFCGMVSLVRPGGWVASFETDFAAFFIDPPLEAHDRLKSAYLENARRQGIDLFIGRRTHQMVRDAGIVDISVDVAIRTHTLGHSRRPIFFDFVNNVREPLIGGGLLSQEDLDRDLEALGRQLADPNTVAVVSLYFRLTGRVRAESTARRCDDQPLREGDELRGPRGQVRRVLIRLRSDARLR